MNERNQSRRPSTERLDAHHRRLRVALELLGLVFLLVAPLAQMVQRPNAHDFNQYYMGGRIALEGAWQALYPQPYPDATLNAGFGKGSRPHPIYRELARQCGVPKGSRFIAPPPMALAMAPVAMLPFPWARLFWTLTMALLCFAAIRESARLLERLHGGPTLWAGIFTLLMCISPLVWRTLRIGQLTPLGAWFIALTATGLASRSAGRIATGVVGASLTKQIGPAYVPLVAVLGQWGALLRMAAASAAVLLLSVVVMGIAPFAAWFDRIVPSMRHSSAWAGNQSISGFLLRWIGTEALPLPVLTALSVGGLASIAVLTMLAWRRRELLRRDPRLVVATLGAFTITAMIFSPIAWEHYHLYLLPAWAWLIAEALRKRRFVVAAVVIPAASWAPVCVFDDGGVITFEPLVSHMLWGAVALLVLTSFNLVRAAQDPGVALSGSHAPKAE